MFDMDPNMWVQKNPHLRRYLLDYKARKGRLPKPYVSLSFNMKYLKNRNFLYPVGDPIFIHVYGDSYHVVEPELTDKEYKVYRKAVSYLLRKAPYIKEDDVGKALMELFDRVWPKIGKELNRKRVWYMVERDVLKYGVIEGIIRDPFIEDIHFIGKGDLYVHHRVFEFLRTNISFRDEREREDFLYRLSEKSGRPVSHSKPIVDASLPEGSRLNIIYSDDVSLHGPSFTIRKFTEEPISITQLIKWNTLSSTIAAYLWMCIENGMSLFVCGETASGKTTTLNALSIFIKPDSKIYSAEETPEIVLPHEAWQRLITREGIGERKGVDLFDLLKAALRSRPNYIIVGEIRGAEGAVAFQAMQTGHPVLSTFHASSVKKMLERLTGKPINVPVRYMDNLNAVVFQQLVYIKGNMERRATTLNEVLGYSRQNDAVLTRNMFAWDAFADIHRFNGLYNSFVLEEKIAPKLGLADPRDVYKELDARRMFLEDLVKRNVFRQSAIAKKLIEWDKKKSLIYV